LIKRYFSEGTRFTNKKWPPFFVRFSLAISQKRTEKKINGYVCDAVALHVLLF
jgi:hypothetical protein